jgi:hypothetical protein
MATAKADPAIRSRARLASGDAFKKPPNVSVSPTAALGLSGSALDLCSTCAHADHLSKMVQICNVPDAVHRTLTPRAATAGQSLSDYLLAEIQPIAASSDPGGDAGQLHSRRHVTMEDAGGGRCEPPPNCASRIKSPVRFQADSAFYAVWISVKCGPSRVADTDSASPSRRGETQRDELHENPPKRRAANRRGERRNRSKPSRNEAERNPNTDLWTTVSGFESLPPSQ